jgi:hypothetical protein
VSLPIVRGTIGQGIGGHTRPTRGLTDVWLTPPDLLARLGDFDLDPCAVAEPRPWPTARRHYAPPQNGLALPWEGRVWCNPPYGAQVGRWLARLAEHGHGLALTFARTDVAWWRAEVVPKAAACLFLYGRLHFCHADGTRAKRNAGGSSVLIAYGDCECERLSTLARIGWYVRLT